MYIKEADRLVREQFGGGTWGIPRGVKSHDPNPYKWIALRRWVNSRMRMRQRRLYELVKSKTPALWSSPRTHPEACTQIS